MSFPVIITGCQSSGTSNLAHILSKYSKGNISGIEDGILRIALIWFSSLRNKEGGLHWSRFEEFAFCINVRKGRGKQYDRAMITLDKFSKSALFQRHIDNNDVDGFISDFLKEYYRQSDYEFWGDKYPEYVFYLDDIRRILPDARFIFLIRHPYYVVYSLYIKRFREGRCLNLNHPRIDGNSFVHQWVVWNTHIVSYLKKYGNSNCLLLKYEDMLGDPLKTLGDISTFLGYDLCQEKEVVAKALLSRNCVRDLSDPHYSTITAAYSERLLRLADYFGYDPYNLSFKLYKP
jgi:hypothetical protein